MMKVSIYLLFIFLTVLAVILYFLELFEKINLFVLDSSIKSFEGY